MPKKPNSKPLKAEWIDTPKDEPKSRLEHWHNNLPADRRNPHAKETFDGLIERVVQPVPPKPETKARSGGYSAKRTR